MATLLSSSFKSVKPHCKSVVVSLPNPSKLPKPPSQITPPSSPAKKPSPPLSEPETKNSWTVYLILSTNPPIKTYVGVTNNFPNRTTVSSKAVQNHPVQEGHGFARALYRDFWTKVKFSIVAYAFESKWKSISRKLPRKGRSKNVELAEESQPWLLQHRCAALNKLKDLVDCSCLEINWSLDPL